MPPKDDKKKKPPPRPECIHPVEVHLPDEMSPEFYLNQIAELEICVERLDTLLVLYTRLYHFIVFLVIRTRPTMNAKTDN